MLGFGFWNFGGFYFFIILDELNMVPYAEPSAFTKGFSSPYYKESHLIFKLAIRKFINEKVIIN